jgi:hypothetical protein
MRETAKYMAKDMDRGADKSLLMQSIYQLLLGASPQAMKTYLSIKVFVYGENVLLIYRSERA